MRIRPVIAVAALLLTAACARPAGDGPADMARVAAANGVAARDMAAREMCALAGFAQDTSLFAHCVARHHARAAARLRAEARMLAASAARRQGVCLDPVRFRLARCIEV